QKEIVEWFTFDAYPPWAQFTFGGRVGAPDEFRVSGHAVVSNCAFKGVPVEYGEGDVSIVTNVMTYANARVRRPEGMGFGHVVHDFNTQFVYLNVTSSLNPQAVAKAIGPVSDRFMQQFRIEGVTTSVVHGVLDYGTWTRTDIEADVKGRKVGMQWCLADEAAFHFRMFGRRVEITAATGTVYNGSAAGQAFFYPVGSDTNMRYEIMADLGGLDFSRLLQALRKDTNSMMQQGILSGKIDVAGFFGQGRGDTAQGRGWVKVKDGQLFDLYILGQLSRWLSRLFPGFGSFRQTDFACTYEIGDRKVSTSDAVLEGDILSLTGNGEYQFNHSLDYRVQVQPLRAGMIAMVLRTVTFPVSKLLEFRLIGTVEEPRWRPVNFPKEMFLIFD
ncbi:MAG: AsmA-like C-terminal region-containing protein, partial [Lentisphaerota bacterium]